MATDLESGIDQGEFPSVRSGIKITGLHIRGLKSIVSLDLPEEGLGWDGAIPDFVMIGGINGSGKTTILEFLAGAFKELSEFSTSGSYAITLDASLRAHEAVIDFEFPLGGSIAGPVRFMIGSQAFIEQNQTDKWFGLMVQAWVGVPQAIRCGNLSPQSTAIAQVGPRFAPSRGLSGPPRVVYFPSERRTLFSPPTNYKVAGKMLIRPDFVDRWTPPESWEDSLEARLYAIRWEDLNAKEEGRQEELNGFDAYARAFNLFFEGRKQLRWHQAELVVETKSGEIHDLSALSSGEKQVILFMGELLDRWRPGSLILIDEPELHLHESYQTRLWEALVDWQKERGGQVILATQSDHLFGLSGPGTRVILGGRPR